MKQKTVYVSPNHVCYPSPVDGSVQMFQLDADEGKVLVNPSYENVYLRKIVDSTNEWTEIDAPIEEDDDATESDYITALQDLGVTLDA